MRRIARDVHSEEILEEGHLPRIVQLAEEVWPVGREHLVTTRDVILHRLHIVIGPLEAGQAGQRNAESVRRLCIRSSLG